jgi:L-threonylcarbamoyladenylate synthase
MQRLIVDPKGADPGALAPAVAWLGQGRAIIFPTDTFYGIGADATNPRAIAALFALKGRMAASALPFVAASRAQVEGWCGPLAGASGRLADAWPGPLTIVLDAPAVVDRAAIGGAETIAIRVPDHPVARALTLAWGAPLPATSANRSGAPPARTVDALDAIADEPDVLVIDAGPAPGGAASTIVDARGDAPRLIREGAIAWSRVLDWLEG